MASKNSMSALVICNDKLDPIYKPNNNCNTCCRARLDIDLFFSLSKTAYVNKLL
jgi:hypothetical protein